MLTVEQIHGAKDFKESVVEVPEWGGPVRIRTLSMAARYEITEKSMRVTAGGREDDNTKFAAATLHLGVIEPKLTYEDAQKIIAAHSFEPIQKLVDEIWKISGMKEDSAKNA